MYINKILSVLFLAMMLIANGVQAGGEEHEGEGLVYGILMLINPVVYT